MQRHRRCPSASDLSTSPSSSSSSSTLSPPKGCSLVPPPTLTSSSSRLPMSTPTKFKMTASRLAKTLAAQSPSVLKSAVAGKMVATHGVGSRVFAVDADNEQHAFLDFSSGIGTLSTGFSHPAVVERVREQAGKIVHAQQNIFASHEPQVELFERLLPLMPAGHDQLFFVNSGSEATDQAMKLARGATGRSAIVAWNGSFHGRTFGALSVTSSKLMYREHMSASLPGNVHFVDFPHCLDCDLRAAQREPYALAPEVSDYVLDQSMQVTDQLRGCCNRYEKLLQRLYTQVIAPTDIAAFIVEPIQGEGGIITPPPSFLRTLREHTRRHGTLLILDEVQSGVGRSGKMWAHEHYLNDDEAPDILMFAKGIASGYPMGGISSRSDIFAKLPAGAIGGTYGGNAAATAAALGTLDAIEADDLLSNARERGEQLVRRLQELAERFNILDIRGVGLMMAIELNKELPKGTASKVCDAAARRGLLLLTAGPTETIRFLPPLVVTADEVDEAMDILGKALADVGGLERNV